MTDVKKYFVFDCETGGIKSDNSLLTLYGMVLDSTFKPVDTIDLKIKPADGLYKVDPRALVVNNIDLVEHDKHAILESEAAVMFNDFSVRHAFGKKMVPIGHNVAFDIKFVKKHLLKKSNRRLGHWGAYYSHRVLDTGTIAHFMAMTGHLPPALSCSLGSLAEYFKLDYSKAHNADFDAKLTLEVLKKLMKLSMTNENSSNNK